MCGTKEKEIVSRIIEERERDSKQDNRGKGKRE